MTTVTHIQQMGEQLALCMDDGSRLMAHPVTSDMWKCEGGPSDASPYNFVQKYGNGILALVIRGGARSFCYPTMGGIWLRDMSFLGTGDPGTGGGVVTPPGPGTGHTVIYPCAEHRVSDSFADHVARGSVNPGTDYIASYGSDVWAVADGVVTDVTNTYGGSGGRMIHIDHAALGTGSDYLHLSDTLGRTVGETVTQGELIAKSGASGFGSNHGYGAHLHLSYRTVLGHAYTNFHSIDFDAYIKSL
jgi:murein DD-endopeptidase MepM/ murein hydrolase activator NlpD